MDPRQLNHRPPSYLSELQAQWHEQLEQLRAKDDIADKAIRSLINKEQQEKNSKEFF